MHNFIAQIDAAGWAAIGGVGAFVCGIYKLDMWLEEQGVMWHQGETSLDPIVPNMKAIVEQEKKKLNETQDDQI